MLKTIKNRNIVRAISFAGAAAAFALIIGPAASYAGDITVRFGDLDLATPSGAAAFNARVDRAADEFCSSYGPSLSRLRTCREDIREEALSKLAESQRHALTTALATEKTHGRRQAQGL